MKRSIVILMMALFIASCKKEGSNPIQVIGVQERVTDYFPLKNGNYWIYQFYRADTSLMFSAQNEFDSIYVEKDSVVNGNVYKVVLSTYWGPLWLLCDSSNYLVTNQGIKIFTINKDTNNLLIQNFPDFYSAWKMKSTDSTCETPVGLFQAKYLICTMTATSPVPSWMRKRIYFYAYAKDVGLICQRSGYASEPSFWEERLVRYKLN